MKGILCIWRVKDQLCSKFGLSTETPVALKERMERAQQRREEQSRRTSKAEQVQPAFSSSADTWLVQQPQRPCDVCALPETRQRLQESEEYVYLSDADAEEEEEDEGIMERAAELKAKITALGGASPSAGVLTELLRVRPKAVVELNVTEHIERSSVTNSKRHATW